MFHQLSKANLIATKVIVDENLRSRLDDLRDQAELCDQSGRTLGRFLPEELYRQWLYATVEIPFSEEEIERRRSATGGHSLAEIWKELGAIEQGVKQRRNRA